MDLATTLAAVTSAKEFASLVINRKIDSAVTEKAIELQNSIIALQSGLLEMQAQIQSLTTRNQALERLLAEVEDWKGEQEQHELQTVAKGVHVVVRRGGSSAGSASIWMCDNCWAKRAKSVLQRTGQDYGGTHYYCPSCGAKINDHSERAMPFA